MPSLETYLLAENLPWKNRFSGRRGFILGSGPSTGQFDLRALKDEICISLNYFPLHPQYQDIVPLFNVIADPVCFERKNNRWQDTLDAIDSSQGHETYHLLPLQYAATTLTSIQWGSFRRQYYLYHNAEQGNPEWDFSQPIQPLGQNTLNIALMWAKYLGLNELFLLGVESGGLHHPTQLEHFFVKKKRHDAGATRFSEKNLALAIKKQVQQMHQIRTSLYNHGISVFNLSPQADFRLFPLLNIEKVPGVGLSLSQPAPPQKSVSHANTVHGRILDHLQKHPQQHLLTLWSHNHWEKIPNQDFHDLITRYISFFQQQQLQGKLLLFMKKTDEHLLAAYLGAMAAGVIPAQLAPQTNKISPKEHLRKLKHIIESTQAQAIFCDTHEFMEADEINITILHPEDLNTSCGQEEFISEDSVALTQFSSGSTGLQKAVMMTHQAILKQMDAYGQSLQLQTNDRVISWLPLYHDMGLMGAFLLPLTHGIPLVLMDPFDWLSQPSLLPKAATEQGGTLCFLPNFAYQLLAEKCPGSNWGHMRAFINCSEPAKQETHSVFLQAFPTLKASQLSVCYALAENCFAVSQTPPGEEIPSYTRQNKSFLSCGKILDITEVSIMNPDEDGIGEIAIRGQSLFSRYLHTEPEMHNGYYLTGDLGFIEKENLVITGRKKDLIIINGKNIYPQDVEFACNQLKDVYSGRCVCFSVPDASQSTEHMIVLVEPAGETPVETILQRISEAVFYEVGITPHFIGIVPYMSLVKTSSGKISRSRNRELFLEKSFNLLNTSK